MTRDEGFVGGLEALVFGVLVFVLGTLIIVNGWAVVDAKFATNAAAREAVRTVVETEAGGGALLERAAAAARQAGAAHGFAVGAVTIEPEGALSQQRCAPVRIRASVEVRSIILPGVAGPGTRTVSSVYEEVIDPFRSGLDITPDLDELAGGPCGF